MEATTNSNQKTWGEGDYRVNGRSGRGVSYEMYYGRPQIGSKEWWG